jgi:hypothetical protein
MYLNPRIIPVQIANLTFYKKDPSDVMLGYTGTNKKKIEEKNEKKKKEKLSTQYSPQRKTASKNRKTPHIL